MEQSSESGKEILQAKILSPPNCPRTTELLVFLQSFPAWLSKSRLSENTCSTWNAPILVRAARCKINISYLAYGRFVDGNDFISAGNYAMHGREHFNLGYPQTASTLYPERGREPREKDTSQLASSPIRITLSYGSDTRTVSSPNFRCIPSYYTIGPDAA